MKPNTLLHRQVNPSWVHNGRVTSQLFKPTPKDGKLLSVYDGDQISAENAWKHFTSQGYGSVGVCSVTMLECEQEALQVKADPIPYPEHVLIDFSGIESKNKIEHVAKRLTEAARMRGWQHKADASLG